MPQGRLSFRTAQAERVVLDGTRLLIGPGASSLALREMIRQSGGKVTPVGLDAEAFDAEIGRLFGLDRQGSDSTGDEVSFDLGRGEDPVVLVRDLLDDDSDAPVIQFVNGLLRKAVQTDASDLHIEPHETGLRVRLRIDGFLQTILDRSNVPVRRVVSRVKVMAGLDIAETRLPQDGRISLRVGGRAIDTRVSTLTGAFGERVVLRILDRKSGLVSLEELGLSKSQKAVLERLAGRPDGVVLATGPTGSGKTTTLYSLLQLADRNERNLITVEDPVEYNLEGLNQTQVNSDIGMTFAAALRASLRQDPDVILVGEIRDFETAGIAAQAAMTGHLVFSSLHANTSVGAIVRLRNLGVEDYLISATLRGVIAQRLLRVLCPVCATRRTPSAAEAAWFDSEGLAVPGELAEQVGCSECNDTGYRGRTGIYEIIEITPDLQAAIDRAASEAELRAIAQTDGQTLRRAALARVAAGSTSLSEVDRVLGTSS